MAKIPQGTYVIVPLDQLSWWERLIERWTPWTRMGPKEWVFCDDRYWDRNIHRRPSEKRGERTR